MEKLKNYVNKYTGSGDALFVAMVANVLGGILSEGIREIEVTKEEYAMIVAYFSHQLPWNWDGTSYWGIKLFIEDKSGKEIMADELIATMLRAVKVEIVPRMDSFFYDVFLTISGKNEGSLSTALRIESKEDAMDVAELVKGRIERLKNP